MVDTLDRIRYTKAMTTTTPPAAYNLTAAAATLGVSATQAARLIETGELVECKSIAAFGRFVTGDSVRALKEKRDAERR